MRTRRLLALLMVSVATSARGATVATPAFSPPGGTYSTNQTVTISDSTVGAKIYYTTNGSTPTTSSTRYTAPITVNASKTLKAIAVLTGFTKSAVGTATYTLVAASPTFSPAAGTYGSSQAVTLSAATPGAKIYYTTNGSTPTASSALYTAPIGVGATTTIQAMATATGYSSSLVGAATYTITPPAATPTFNPPSGTYAGPLTVAIAAMTPGASIYFTTDGTTPHTGSTLYGGPLSISSSTTLKSIVIAPGHSSSQVATASYTITSPTPTPVLFPPPGGYPGPQTITISSPAPDALIYYTLDGSAPTPLSPQYAGPLRIGETRTIRAIALAPGYSESATVSGAYDIPIAPPDGIATESLTVWTGTVPAQVPINLSGPGTVVLALVAVDGQQWQDVSVTDVGTPRAVSARQLAQNRQQPGYSGAWLLTPTGLTSNSTLSISPAFAGHPITVTLVELSGASSSSSRWKDAYGTTGAPSLSMPASMIGSWFFAVGNDSAQAAERTVSAGQTLLFQSVDTSHGTTRWMQARARPAEAGSSSAALGIDAPAGGAWNFLAVEILPTVLPPPTLDPPPGTYDRAQTVRMTSWPGVAVRYTTDGSAPTAASTLYTVPVPIPETATVRAIASASGYGTSAPEGGTYSIVRVLERLVVRAPSAVLNAGASFQCSAIGTFTDGTSRDLTGSVAWTSGSPAVASVTSGGAVTATRAGIAAVTATQGGVSGHLLVTVVEPVPPTASASTYYCYDGAGNLTARVSCPAGQSCEGHCP